MAWLAVVALPSTAVHAGRPLDTEDTGTVASGAAEVEASLDLLRQGVTTAVESRVVVSTGVAPRLEVRVEAAVAALDREGHPWEAGVADSLVGVKYRVWDESGPAPAVLLAAAVRLPTGDADRGLGTPEPAIAALLAASHTFGALTLTANAGYVFEVSGRTHDAAIAAVSAEQRLSSRWTIVAEVFTLFGVASVRHRAIARAGATWQMLDRVRFDAAVGTDLDRLGDGVIVTLGATLRF